MRIPVPRHIDEPGRYHLGLMRTGRLFDRAAVRLDISLPAQLGELRYVCARPFGGGIAYHAVLKTAFGKATLLLLPGRENAARASASARGLQAVVAPATGGSVAIIADSSRSIARIESLIRPRTAGLEWEPGFHKTI